MNAGVRLRFKILVKILGAAARRIRIRRSTPRLRSESPSPHSSTFTRLLELARGGGLLAQNLELKNGRRLVAAVGSRGPRRRSNSERVARNPGYVPRILLRHSRPSGNSSAKSHAGSSQKPGGRPCGRSGSTPINCLSGPPYAYGIREDTAAIIAGARRISRSVSPVTRGSCSDTPAHPAARR